MNNRWLSWTLLVVAYATFGQLLHSNGASDLVWGVTLVFVMVKACVLTLIWQPVRRFVLLGFQSDAGYSIMVLVLASLAVLVVVQFRAFAYVLVLIATTILARVDCLVDALGDRQSLGVLILLPLLGLAISWLSQLERIGNVLN